MGLDYKGDGSHRDRKEAARRRRLGRDRRVDRGALAVLGRRRRPRRQGGAAEARRALDAAERGDARAPAGARARRASSTPPPGCSTSAGRRRPEIISAEAGKPLKAARVEAQRAVSTYTFAAVEARKLAGEMVPMDASAAGDGKLAFTLRLPIGIVGAISPFNFPLNLVAHKIAPALAAGCAGRAEARVRHPALGPLPGAPRGGGGPAGRLAQRRLGTGRRRSATRSSTTSA